MANPLRVLLVEDSESDAELAEFELSRSGFDVVAERVETASELSAALARHRWDVILCDHSLPSLRSLDALTQLKTSGADTPFIVLSGTIGEEAAVEALKKGVGDVVLKSNMSRLGPVVARELEAAADRRRRRAAQGALRQSEARKSAILESALDCVVTIDDEGQIVDFNPAAERTFGYARAQVVGRPIVDLLIPPSLRERHRVGFARYLATGEGPIIGKRVGLTAMRADGSEFPVEVSITASLLADRPFFTGYIRDLTEQKRAEQERKSLEAQFLQSQKLDAIGRLTSGIAHDFRNLLSVVTGYSELILLKGSEGEELRRHIEEIRTAGERGVSLTRQLLAFGRPQAVELQVLSLNTVVSGVEPMLRRLIGEDIRLVTALDPAPWDTRADLRQLEQVIVNLAINARDAMPEGGTLTFETANADLDESFAPGAGVTFEPGRYVVLSVSDTGVGMDEETQARVFEPFFTTKEAGDGTGLGLATVYGIVTQGGGFIAVDSEPGHGAMFRIYLPQAAEDAEPSDPPVYQSDGLTDGSETVLVVDDEDGVRALLRETLTASGYAALEARDGTEARELCETYEGTIDLVLMDLVTPGVRGTELSRRLRAIRPSMRVLYMSAYTERAVADQDDVGPAQFIEKPFTAAALTSSVRRALDAPG